MQTSNLVVLTITEKNKLKKKNRYAPLFLGCFILFNPAFFSPPMNIIFRKEMFLKYKVEGMKPLKLLKLRSYKLFKAWFPHNYHMGLYNINRTWIILEF